MCLNDPSGDPRPRRMIDLCNAKGYAVCLASYEPIKEAITYETLFLLEKKGIGFWNSIFRYLFLAFNIIAGFFIRNDSFLNKLSNRRYYLHKLESELEGYKFDLIILEDIQFLPVVLKIRKGTPVVFDVREYYPRQRENDLIFRLFEKAERVRLCKKYLKECDVLFTVSYGLAQEYKKEFNVNMDVIKSVPNFRDIPVTLKNDGVIRLVHHGVANSSRKLENMIAVLKQLDTRFTLDFYLTGDSDYIDELKAISKNDSRIAFNQPVSFSDLVPTLAKFDVGFFYVEPSTFNLRHCLPNKFFEYIQARLVLAVGPSPDMASLVEEYDCGVISEKFTIESMAGCLQGLTYERIAELKVNSDKASRKLCFEVESEKIINLFTQIVAK